MATGDLLSPSGEPPRLARVLIPPEDAATEALAAYLRCVEFFVHAGAPPVGELSRKRAFRLAHIGTEWPDAGQQLAYPALTIFGGDDTQHTGHGPPRPLEALWDQDCGTVPWNLGVATGTLQLDFWSDSAPVRQAIAARLPGLFSPGESRSGILLELPPEYLSLVGRFSLLSKGRQDSPDTVWAGEHRLRAVVRWEVTDVELRAARALVVQVPCDVETGEL